MRYSFLIALLLASLIATLNKDAHAQSLGACESAISAMKNDIEERVGGKVEAINENRAKDPPSPFTGRDAELNVFLSNIPGTVRGRNPATPSQSAKNHAITNSRSLMNSYSRQIIESCPKIARVTFTQGFHSEGVFVLMRNGTVSRAECRYPGGGNLQNLKWGEELCL
jgi:hypothetical protein